MIGKNDDAKACENYTPTLLFQFSVLFFSVVYLTLALNSPVKIYGLIHANKKIHINKAKYTINVFYIFSHKFHKTVTFLI